MNLKRGFTLIELLAVIIILAIVALIATPIILDVVNDARKSAGLSESNMIYSSINNYCASIEMKKQLGTLGSEDVDCSGKTSFTTEEISKMVNLGNAQVESNSYTSGKLTNLVVVSNNNRYVLCSNGSMALEGECDANSSTDSEEPSLPESVSFAEDSWETIAAIVKAGKADQYYNVGDEKEVTLDGYTNGSESTFTVRIANMSTPEECSTEGFSQTACGFVVEFVDIITTHVMNSNYSSPVDWLSSEMHDFVNTNIYNALQSDLKKNIIDTYTKSGYMSEKGDSYIDSSLDKIYLLSSIEITSKDSFRDVISNYTRPLDFYVDCLPNNCLKLNKEYQKNTFPWWTRSTPIGDPYTFYIVIIDIEVNLPNAPFGVAPAFRIG